MLVSQAERCVEVWTRSGDDTWSAVTVHGGGGVAELTAIEARLPVDELYDAAAEPD